MWRRSDQLKEIDTDGESVNGRDGTPYYKFGCDYVMPDGTEWGFDIWAKDWMDADERIRAIKLTVRNGGQIIETIPDSE